MEEPEPAIKKSPYRAALYALTFFLFAQAILELLIPGTWVYDCRLDYDAVKDNLVNLVTTVVKRQIRRQAMNEYIVLLGDSITYSGPGGPTQSVSYYMDQRARTEGLPRVFNFAMPAGQMGDFYAILLMLDEKGISTDHVVLNVTYAGFVERDPDPPIVYWFEEDLRRLDPEAYREIATDLERSTENKNRVNEIESFLERSLCRNIPVLKYRDFLRARLEHIAGIKRRDAGDPRPWYEKDHLREVLKEPVYQRQFDPSPLILDGSNPNVEFLRKIAEHQAGKSLLVYLSPINHELMSDEVGHPGFADNMNRLRRYLEGMSETYGFAYEDLSGSLDCKLFSDHLHLTPEGYMALGDILWEAVLRQYLLGEDEGVASWGFTRRSS